MSGFFGAGAAQYTGVMLGLVYNQDPGGGSPLVFAFAGISAATMAAINYTYIGVGKGLITVGNSLAGVMVFTTSVDRSTGPVGGYNVQFAGTGGGGTGWLLNLYNAAGVLVDETNTGIWLCGLADQSNGPF